MLLFLAWCEARSPFAEARWGTVYVTSAALLILFLVINPYAEAHIATLVEGRIITVTAAQLRILLGAAVVVAILFLLFRKEILLSSFDPEMAISLGLRPSRWDGLLYLLMGLVISTGVMSMGPLFVFGYLLLPAFAVRPWVAGLKRFALFSVILGIVSAFVGSLIGFWFDWPLGPAEVAAAALFLFASRLFHLLYRTVVLQVREKNSGSSLYIYQPRYGVDQPLYVRDPIFFTEMLKDLDARARKMGIPTSIPKETGP
jgi:ABC-type Mn2+/Zn2+ transport system permease subunit